MGGGASTGPMCGSDSIIKSRANDVPSFKLVIVGDPEVGKTAIFLRYTRNQFDYSYHPTLAVNIGNVVMKVNVPFNTLVSITVWDLPGREEVDLRRSYYKDIDAAIVVADLSDPDTVEMAGTWKQDIVNNLNVDLSFDTPQQQQRKNKAIPILLVGNKSDKLTTEEAPNALETSLEKLEQVAAEHNFVGCVTVSAKENDGGVHTALQSLVRHLLEKHVAIKKTVSEAIDLSQLFANHQSINKYIQSLTSAEDHHPIPLQSIGITEVDDIYENVNRHLHIVERNCIKLVLASRRMARTCCIAGITNHPTSEIPECMQGLKEAIDTDCEDALKTKEEDSLIQLELCQEDKVTPILTKIVEIYTTEVFEAYQSIRTNCSPSEEKCRESIVQLTSSNRKQNEQKSSNVVKMQKAQKQKFESNLIRLRTTVKLGNKAIQLVAKETEQIRLALL